MPHHTLERPRFLFRGELRGWRRRTLPGALGMRLPVANQRPDENRLLAEAARGAAVSVEIGAFEGGGSITIRHEMQPGGVLTVVDPYPRGRFGICGALITAKRQARRQPHVRTDWRRVRSSEAVAFWRGEIDLLFVDGAHSLAGVREDWHVWGSFVRRGGKLVARNTVVADLAQSPEARSRELLALAAPNPGSWRFVGCASDFCAFERID